LAGRHRRSPCAALATVKLYSTLRSDLEGCCPERASVLALDELRSRMAAAIPGRLVDVGTADNLPARAGLLDDLATRVRAYPPDMVRAVRPDGQPSGAHRAAPALVHGPGPISRRCASAEGPNPLRIDEGADMLLDGERASPFDRRLRPRERNIITWLRPPGIGPGIVSPVEPRPHPYVGRGWALLDRDQEVGRAPRSGTPRPGRTWAVRATTHRDAGWVHRRRAHLGPRRCRAGGGLTSRRFGHRPGDHRAGALTTAGGRVPILLAPLAIARWARCPGESALADHRAQFQYAFLVRFIVGQGGIKLRYRSGRPLHGAGRRGVRSRSRWRQPVRTRWGRCRRHWPRLRRTFPGGDGVFGGSASLAVIGGLGMCCLDCHFRFTLAHRAAG